MSATLYCGDVRQVLAGLPEQRIPKLGGFMYMPGWIGASMVRRTRGGNYRVEITPAVPDGSRNPAPTYRRYVSGNYTEQQALNFVAHLVRYRAVLWSDGERLIVACRQLRPSSPLSGLSADLRQRFGGDYIHRDPEAQRVVQEFLAAHDVEVQMYDPADNFAGLRV